MAIGDLDYTPATADAQGGGVDPNDYGYMQGQLLNQQQPGQSPPPQPRNWQDYMHMLGHSLQNMGQNYNRQGMGLPPIQNLQQQQQQSAMQNLQNNPLGKGLANLFKKLFKWNTSSNSFTSDNSTSTGPTNDNDVNGDNNSFGGSGFSY